MRGNGACHADPQNKKEGRLFERLGTKKEKEEAKGEKRVGKL